MNCDSSMFLSLSNRDDPRMAFWLVHNYCVLHCKEWKEANAIVDFIQLVSNFLECAFVQALSLVIGSASFSNLLRAY